VDGVGGGDTNGVGCWLEGGWGVGMVSAKHYFIKYH